MRRLMCPMGPFVMLYGVYGAVEIALLVFHECQFAPRLASPIGIFGHSFDERAKGRFSLLGSVLSMLNSPAHQRNDWQIEAGAHSSLDQLLGFIQPMRSLV